MISSGILGRAHLRISPSLFMFGATSCWYTAQAASSLQHSCEAPAFSVPEDEEYADVDWDTFGLMPADYMYVMKCAKDCAFERGRISPYENIELSPSAGVLNYSQGLFEGQKAHRKENGSLPPVSDGAGAAKTQG